MRTYFLYSCNTCNILQIDHVRTVITYQLLLSSETTSVNEPVPVFRSYEFGPYPIVIRNFSLTCAASMAITPLFE